jgi:hypothetical protein
MIRWGGKVRAGRVIRVAIATLGLGACAAPVQRLGGPAADWPSGARFVMAVSGGGGNAATAVRDALVARGFRPAEDGRYRVEVGFAIRPRQVRVTGPADTLALSPSLGGGLSLCLRRTYVLSIALVERTTGAVAVRTGAATSRCGDSAGSVMPRLVAAALPPVS